MSDGPVLPEGDRREVLEMMAQYDAPAYARRARGVEQALEGLLDRCRAQRAEWLEMVSLRLGQLFALAGSWDALAPWLDKADRDSLAALHEQLKPKLRIAVEPTTSRWALRRAIRELAGSMERFNRRWHEHLNKVDLRPVNELREGYNRYYVLEKECALRNSALARMGFKPLAPLSVADLAAHLPLLPVPTIRKGA